MQPADQAGTEWLLGTESDHFPAGADLPDNQLAGLLEPDKRLVQDKIQHRGQVKITHFPVQAMGVLCGQ